MKPGFQDAFQGRPLPNKNNVPDLREYPIDADDFGTFNSFIDHSKTE